MDSFSVSHQRVNIVNLSASMTKHNLLTNRHLKIANEEGQTPGKLGFNNRRLLSYMLI